MTIFVLTFFISTFFISTIFILVYLIWNDLLPFGKKIKFFFYPNPHISNEQKANWHDCKIYLRQNSFYVTDDIDEDEKDKLLSAIYGLVFNQYPLLKNLPLEMDCLYLAFLWTFIKDDFIVDEIQEFLLKTPYLNSLGMKKKTLKKMVVELVDFTSNYYSMSIEFDDWLYEQNRLDSFLKSIYLLFNKNYLFNNKKVDSSKIQKWSDKINKTKDLMLVEDYIESLFRKTLFKDLVLITLLSVAFSYLLTLFITNFDVHSTYLSAVHLIQNAISLWEGV